MIAFYRAIDFHEDAAAVRVLTNHGHMDIYVADLKHVTSCTGRGCEACIYDNQTIYACAIVKVQIYPSMDLARRYY